MSKSAARVYAGANEKFGRPWWDYGEYPSVQENRRDEMMDWGKGCYSTRILSSAGSSFS
jgi:hypothetical protein